MYGAVHRVSLVKWEINTFQLFLNNFVELFFSLFLSQFSVSVVVFVEKPIGKQNGILCSNSVRSIVSSLVMIDCNEILCAPSSSTHLVLTAFESLMRFIFFKHTVLMRVNGKMEQNDTK